MNPAGTTSDARREATPERSWIPVQDFAFPAGWLNAAEGEQRARWYCERLEEGQIVFFSSLPFNLSNADRQFLVARHWAGSAVHKNVSYRPVEDLLRGFTADKTARNRMHQLMRNYSAQVVQFLTRFLSPYAGQWSLDFASFRPLEEEGRKLPLHKRNDLLHVDAFPSRPTRGGRILRVFTNLNSSKPHVWLTTDRFPALAERYAFQVGLRQVAAGSWLRQQLYEMGRALGLPGVNWSPYDQFMLRFHDYLKENSAFQASCEKIRIEFPPLATWLVFTDGVPHAALSGQFVLEQTLIIIPPTALVAPQHAPIRVLEALCGRPLAA